MAKDNINLEKQIKEDLKRRYNENTEYDIIFINTNKFAIVYNIKSKTKLKGKERIKLLDRNKKPIKIKEMVKELKEIQKIKNKEELDSKYKEFDKKYTLELEEAKDFLEILDIFYPRKDIIKNV